jgi:hypothetical protein
MPGKNTTIFGIYPYYSSVEHAVTALREAGFRNTNISVVFPENAGSMNFAREMCDKPPEGVVGGGITGAVVGGTLGWLVGVGALAIPGLGPVIAAGPIMAALAGVGVGGTAGGIAGALIGMEIPEHIAQRYEDRVRDGGIIASVHCEEPAWIERAQEIMEHTGAQDISSTGNGNAGGMPAQCASGTKADLKEPAEESGAVGL